ncbi:hypothetical protein [Paradesulfitobacterium ferrireducens]|uniref:hypothetical protein n=1 Tax=Paradesulfitobacterium ferrireducens TaxID=2816476 RepID=UPI001A8F44B1|nr:hypothetical protein [Paradesulfitobacterium ferrireducens]
MENGILSKSTAGYGLSLAVVSIFSGLLVIVKETYTPLMDWMKALTGHHWITHGVFDIILFFVLGYLFSKSNLAQKMDADKLTKIIIWSVVIGVVLISGFNLAHNI